MVAFYLLGNKVDKKVAVLSSHVVCVQLCYLHILFHFCSLLLRAHLIYYNDNYLGMGISITRNIKSCIGKTIPMRMFGDNTVIQHGVCISQLWSHLSFNMHKLNNFIINITVVC